jgi:hypothetical protein
MTSRARRTRSRAERDRGRSQMLAGGIQGRRVSQAELHMHGSRDPDQLRHVVQPDDSSEVVGRLDVDVERHGDGCADRRDVWQAEVAGMLSVPAPRLWRT